MARAIRRSKFLSLVLRHDPAAAGVTLDEEGWVPIEDLLAGAQRAGVALTRAELLELVATSDKRRFAIDEVQDRIRANQGHSVAVDLGLTPLTPPLLLYHGTVEARLPSIFRDGLRRMRRHHVHLSSDIPTASRVGARRGHPVILSVDAKRMHEAGHCFFRSVNDVWLTEHVPSQYLRKLSVDDEG